MKCHSFKSLISHKTCLQVLLTAVLCSKQFFFNTTSVFKAELQLYSTHLPNDLPIQDRVHFHTESTLLRLLPRNSTAIFLSPLYTNFYQHLKHCVNSQTYEHVRIILFYVKHFLFNKVLKISQCSCKQELPFILMAKEDYTNYTILL